MALNQAQILDIVTSQQIISSAMIKVLDSQIKELRQETETLKKELRAYVGGV